MKVSKFFNLILLFSIFSLLTSCSISSRPSTAPSTLVSLSQSPDTTAFLFSSIPPTSPSATTFNPSYSYDVEADYLNLLSRETTLRTFFTDAQLIELGWTVCNFFARGGTVDEMAEIFTQTGLESGLSRSQILELAEMAAIAVVVFCPQNKWRL